MKNRAAVLAPSTLAVVYFGTLVPLFNAAVLDKRIGSSPCVDIRLPEIPDGIYHIAKPEQVHQLHDALPERYRPIVYLAAGCGWRGGEIFGLEVDAVDLDAREAHVRHQLTVVSGRQPHLAPPKTKTSRRTNELPDFVARSLRGHLEEFPIRPEWIEDETGREPVRRPARLLFTRGDGRPIHRADWSYIWRPAVRAADRPDPDVGRGSVGSTTTPTRSIKLN